MQCCTSLLLQVALLGRAPGAHTDVELALLLSKDATRKEGVSRAVSTREHSVPVLLQWTKDPPAIVDKHELFIGMADVFGELKVKEAIPFLVQNILMQRWMEANIWMKTDKVLQERLPAAGALVRIGPDATFAILERYSEFGADERAAAIFTIAQIEDPRAREFLMEVTRQAALERYWSEQGLKRMGAKR